MIKTILACWILCLTCQMLLAQQSILLEQIKITEEYSSEIKQSINDFIIVRLDFNVLRNITTNNNGYLDFHLKVGDAYDWEISLEENNIQSPNYRMEENNKQIDRQPKTVTTYKGLINGNSSNHVRLAISETMFEGYFLDESEMIFIRPLNKIIPNYLPNDHFIIFNAKEIKDNLNIKECGIAEIKKIFQSQSKSLTTARAATTCRVLEIATEADFEFFQANGSNVATANNSILATLNQVEGVYQTTFNIRFLVAFQSVWSTSNDPYTISGSTNVVDELANWWQANRTTVSRDIVFFFSAKTGHTVKGSARILGGAVCSSQVNSYAFSATAVTNDLIITTAHEIGHLFSATHPDVSGAACSPTRTIMCIDPNNLGRVLQFANFSQDEINTWINGNSACLMDVLNVNIGGADPICTTGQLSVIGLPPNSSTTSWSSAYTSGLTITNSGFATRQSNYLGQVNVTANGNFGNAGCTFSSTKLITVGAPLITNQRVDGSSYYGPTYICPGSHWLQVTPVGTTSNANWTVQSGVPFVVSPNYLDFYMYSNVASVAITANATNACGTGPNAAFYLMKKTWGCPSSFSIAASPNPVAEELTVTTISTSDISEAQIIFGTHLQDIPPSVGRAVLFDGQAQSIVEGQWIDGTLKLNVRGLKRGLYFLHIYIDDKVYKEQIIVE